MTNEQRIENLKALGYTDREARFLCLAALHSGYFVRRQFLSFAGQIWGKTDTALAEKVIKNGHAKPLMFRYKRVVFSLCSKPFFAAIGESENRNRRCHEVLTIKNRLIGLDFVLGHRRLEYLATEHEKVSFFRERFDIATTALPSKIYRSQSANELTVRHFVDKFPLAFQAVETGPPIMVFTYVDEGAHSTSGFEKHLNRYQLLLAHIPAFRLVYIGPFSTHFETARRIFDRMIGRGANPVPADPAIARMLEYFHDRDAFERNDLVRFDQRRLIQFREDRKQYSSVESEELFHLWQRDGDTGVLLTVAPECTRHSNFEVEFGTWLSAFRYELLGTLTNGDWRGV